MKHVKKLLSCVLVVALLVTACLTDGFGVFAGLMDSTANTSVTKIDIANQALRFYLSDNDYGTTNESASNQSAASYTDYNYWENIQIYTDDTTSKTLSEAYAKKANAGNTTFYNLWTVWGTYAVSLDQDSLDNAVKVIIPAGTQFPSYAYTTGASAVKKAYVTTEETIFIKKGEAWEKYIAPTPVDTEVTAFSLANNGFKFKLSVNDYGNTKGSDTSADSYTVDYNYMSKIVVYTDDTTSYKLKNIYNSKASDDHHTFFNLWTDWGTFTVQTDTTVLNAATKVVIPAGTEFPSLKYATGTSTDKIGYVTTAEKIYVRKGDAWEEYIAPTPVNTEVTALSLANNGFKFKLSVNDYGNTKGSDTSADSYTVDYNYMSKIVVYTDDTTSYKLQNIYNSKASDDHHTFFNLWTDWGTFTVQTDTTVLNAATKVVIPAGTEFPSLKYATGTSTDKIAYVTTAEKIYVRKGDAWEEHIAPITRDTSVTELALANNGFKFRLSVNDYGNTKGSDTSADSYTAEYNYLDNVLVYTDSTTSYKLKNVYNSKASDDHHTFFNLWTDWGTFAVQIDTTVLNAATKVVIPAGTSFPSLEYATGASKGKISYVTTDEITFVKKGDVWEEYIEHIEKATDIEKIHVRNGFVLLFLSNHDYAEVGHTEQIGDRLSAYNLTDNIMVTTAGGTKKLSEILGSELYYNIWTETGCVALKMDSGYDGTTITRVAVKKGAEFPAYAYTSTTTKKVTSYVTDRDYVFTTSQLAVENTGWTKVTPHSTKTNVSRVAMTDTTLTLTLSESDYVSGTVGSDHTDFDYWKNIRIYTSDTEYLELGTWGNLTGLTYGENTLSITGSSSDIVRVVIPAKTVFPSYKYTSGQIGELVGYYVPGEIVFENQDGTWKDVSAGISNMSGDVNGDSIVDSRDLVSMAKYANNGYRYNVSSLTYDAAKDAVGNRENVRKVLIGESLHNYVKESESLTYFSSSDIRLDWFLNDFYKRQVGYNDYVEGDMTVTSSKPGTVYNGIFNQSWVTKSLMWVDSKNSLESDRAAQLKEQLNSIIVDRYGYVWNKDDAVESPTLGIGKQHGMGWPFPNAAHAGGSGDSTNVRFWEFNETDSLSTWSSNISASLSDGLYKGTASGKDSVTFTVEDKENVLSQKSPIIRDTECAPWLTLEVRMSDMVNPENIDDIYVSWVNTDSSTTHTVKAGDVAALNYDFTDNYEHVLYLPMYTQPEWNGKQINKITIEIRAQSGKTFGGTIALNYVRPSFDTRHSNNNANYIESLTEYYNMTGDVEFLQANITKARKAMNFYLQMYDDTQKLNDQSYIYGHGGSRTELKNGLGNGYWDILYTPRYDFQSNMYFYQALKDLNYLEGILSNKGISVSDSAEIATATTDGTASSIYSKTASDLDTIASDVLGAMRTYFWNSDTGRFMAGYDNSSNKVDYGYTVWNLEAIDRGIATDEQKASIMSWIDGTENLYNFGFAPRTATVDDKGTSTNASGIYGAFIAEGGNDTVKNQKFGESLQFGGAVMYSSYYDLMSRIQIKGADNALERLKGIQTWYEGADAYFKSNTVANDEFYLSYFVNKLNIKPQNGIKGYGNGAVGIDGEFTESLLVASAIPYGFFGMDSKGGNTLCVSPSLSSTMDRWKVENMQFNGVTYDLSIYKDAVRIDSVRGNADGLSVKVTLDCPAGKAIYVDGVKKDVTAEDGKVTVTVPFSETIIEVK